jgi:hypothetical protein
MLAHPTAPSDDVLKRVRLAYVVILLARGIPAIYYGDEQGFTGIPNGAGPIDAQVVVEPGSARWTSVSGACEVRATATGSYRVRVAPLDYRVCRSASGAARSEG